MIAVAAGAAFSSSPASRADDSKPGDDQIFQRLDNTPPCSCRHRRARGRPHLRARGLEGLTQYLTFRTTSNRPLLSGLDITKDELAFHLIIYWPISPPRPCRRPPRSTGSTPTCALGGTRARQRATSSAPSTTAAAPAPMASAWQILANLDMLPLEPVPPITC